MEIFNVQLIFRNKNENLKTQKEIRRRMREEKRKTKILKKLEVTGSDEINEKIAKEEKKLVKVQRKLEAIRVVEELFKRIKVSKTSSVGCNTFTSIENHKNIFRRKMRVIINATACQIPKQMRYQ